jgi:hypothetical protein
MGLPDWSLQSSFLLPFSPPFLLILSFSFSLSLVDHWYFLLIQKIKEISFLYFVYVLINTNRTKKKKVYSLYVKPWLLLLFLFFFFIVCWIVYFLLFFLLFFWVEEGWVIHMWELLIWLLLLFSPSNCFCVVCICSIYNNNNNNNDNDNDKNE